MTKPDLDELRRLEKEARWPPPTPLEIDPEGDIAFRGGMAEWIVVAHVSAPPVRPFVVALLNAAPWLLDRITPLEERLEKLERVREAAIVISAGGLWHEETEAHDELRSALRAAEETSRA